MGCNSWLSSLSSSPDVLRLVYSMLEIQNVVSRVPRVKISGYRSVLDFHVQKPGSLMKAGEPAHKKVE